MWIIITPATALAQELLSSKDLFALTTFGLEYDMRTSRQTFEHVYHQSEVDCLDISTNKVIRSDSSYQPEYISMIFPALLCYVPKGQGYHSPKILKKQLVLTDTRGRSNGVSDQRQDSTGTSSLLHHIRMIALQR